MIFEPQAGKFALDGKLVIEFFEKYKDAKHLDIVGWK